MTWGKSTLNKVVRHLRNKQQQIKGQLLAIPALFLLVRAVRRLGPDDASLMAGAVAFYALISLFPLLLGLLALLGLFLPSESLQEHLFNFVETNFPTRVDLLERNISDVIRLRGAMGVLSLVLLFWTGS